MSDRPLNILMIAPCPFFMLRGKPIRVLNNTAALALLGHTVDVVTYPQGEPLRNALPPGIVDAVESRVTLHRIGEASELSNTAKPGLSLKKLMSVPRLYLKARSLLKKNRYDLLYCHDIDGALVGTQLKRAFRSTGLRMVYDMHGSFRELMSNIHGSGGNNPLGSFYGLFEKKAYRDADVVLANWPHLVPLVKSHTDPAKVFLVQDKPLLSALEELERSQRSTTLKERMGIRNMLVYTGNFASYQRVDILLDMMRILQDRGVDATLVLAGAGSAEMEARAKQMGLNNTRFVGTKYGQELSELLMNADLALSPRVTENYPPMKVITYIMARLPVVATDLPSHRQMVEHESSALLCEATPEAFADATIRLLEDAPLRERLRAGLDQEARRYTMDRLLEELGTALSAVSPAASPAPTA